MEATSYRDLFESLPVALLRFAPDGRLLDANPAAVQALGYPDRATLLASKPVDLFSRAADATGLLAKLARDGAVRDAEVQLRCRGGAMLWVWFSACATTDATGRVVCYEGAAQDITERKRAEDALHRLSTRLLQSQDSERRRIARELHDSTGQNLAALAMHLTRLSESSADLPSDARQSLSTCLLLADQCSREIRILSYLLHPPMLDELGLASALQWYADGFGQRSGIKVDLEVPPDLGRLPQEVEIALFRVIQECLTNIHRHSGSATATIRLAKQPDCVVLEVQDAGRGMAIADTDGRPTELGVGVMGMRERVQELGGQLSIKSGPQGTTVRATLPLAGGVA